MISSVEFQIIDNKKYPCIFFVASKAHANLNTRFLVLKNGVSIKIKDKFLRVIFKPGIYI